MGKTKVIIIFDGYCVSFMKLLFYLLYYFYEIVSPNDVFLKLSRTYINVIFVFGENPTC